MSLDDVEDSNQSKESKYIKLISEDGLEFIVEKSAACASGFINRLIHGSAKWEETQGAMPTMPFKNISGDILEIVIKYFYFKQKYENANTVNDEDPPDFGISHIPPQKVVQVLMAAHYLDC